MSTGDKASEKTASGDTAYTLTRCLTLDWDIAHPRRTPPHISIGDKESEKQTQGYRIRPKCTS